MRCSSSATRARAAWSTSRPPPSLFAMAVTALGWRGALRNSGADVVSRVNARTHETPAARKRTQEIGRVGHDRGDRLQRFGACSVKLCKNPLPTTFLEETVTEALRMMPTDRTSQVRAVV